MPFENVRDNFSLVANLLAAVLVKKSAIWPGGTEFPEHIFQRRSSLGVPELRNLNQTASHRNFMFSLLTEVKDSTNIFPSVNAHRY